jgi:hypothetical protein
MDIAILRILVQARPAPKGEGKVGQTLAMDIGSSVPNPWALIQVLYID